MSYWFFRSHSVWILFILSFTAYGLEDLVYYNVEINNESDLSFKLLDSKFSHIQKRQQVNQNQTTTDNRTNQKVVDPPLQISTTSPLLLDRNISAMPVEIKKSISKFANEEGTASFNTTSEQNINRTRTDGHMYYSNSSTTDPAILNYYWVNMENQSNVIVNELLSTSHRRTSVIQLSFNFPFYGHIIQTLTITSGGFLHMGQYAGHSWLAATQYIAPLMANFDISLSNDSFVRYRDNGTAFTVEWVCISLHDRPNDGQFTFQTTLFDNGDIVFAYKNVPSVIQDIQDDFHPVKVGLSDAYIIERTIFYARRKTIYEYNRVSFKKEDIKNSTVIYLKPLPRSKILDHKTMIAV